MEIRTLLLVLKLSFVVTTTIRGPPRADKSEIRHVAKIGDNIKLKCPIHGYPAPMVSWEKDKDTITFAWSRFKTNKKSLKIKSVVKEDMGVYMCKGINGFGKVETRIELVVINPDDFPNIMDSDIPKLAPPVFTKETIRTDKDISVDAGESVTMVCSAIGLPEPRISWYKNNELFRDSGISLTIHQSTIRDSGTYSCVAQNMVGSASAKYRITVQEVADLNHDASNVSVQLGESAVLDCRVNSDRKPSVKWLKKLENMQHGEDSKVISVGSEQYRIIGDDEDMLHSGEREYLSQLAIRAARPEDSGMYICFVTSGGRGFNFKHSFLTVIENVGREVDRQFPVIVVVLVLAIAITLSLIGMVLCLIQKKPKVSPPTENSDIQQKELVQQKLARKNNKSNNMVEPAGVRVTVNQLEEMLGETSALNPNVRDPLHSTYLMPHAPSQDCPDDHLQQLYDMPRGQYGYFTARTSSEKSFCR